MPISISSASAGIPTGLSTSIASEASETSPTPSVATDGWMTRALRATTNLGTTLGLTAPQATESTSSVTPQQAAQMRAFALDLVKASAVAKSEQPQAIRAAIAEHPEVFAWLIEGHDITEIIEAAELPRLPPTVHAVLHNLPRVGSSITQAWQLAGIGTDLLTNTASLGRAFAGMSETTLLETSKSILPSFLYNRVQFFSRAAITKYLVAEAAKQASVKLRTLSPEKRAELLSYAPDSAFGSIATQIEDGIDQAKFSDSEEIKMMLDPNRGFDLSQVAPTFAGFFRIVLTDYFDRLPVEDKRSIIEGILELPPGASTSKKLAAILNGAGPAIQKLFQLFGEDVKSEQVAEVMRELKANIKSFPSEQAVEIIERDLGGSIDEIFSEFRMKPLAAASVGQVYLAVIRETNEEVIVKVLRPGLRDKARREIALLKDLAPSSGMKKIVGRLEESLLEELDLRLEADNMRAGEVYFRPQKGIAPVYTTDLPTSKDVLIMDRAYDNTINKFDGDDLDLKREALGELLQLWFDEALFGSGFFHGDLHAGNIFFSPKPIPGYAPYGRDYQLTMIDFGNAATLTSDEQRALIGLILGSASGSAPAVMASLEMLAPMTPEQSEALGAYVAATMEESEDASNAMDSIINRAIDLDVDLPKSLILFNRGRAFIEKQIGETNDQLDEYDPYDTLERSNPRSIYQGVMMSRIGTELVKSAFGLHGERGSRLDPAILMEILKQYTC